MEKLLAKNKTKMKKKNWSDNKFCETEAVNKFIINGITFFTFKFLLSFLSG
jgi:hypothetical protein